MCQDSPSHVIWMWDTTFELLMLIFKLTVTPLMKDGCWVPLFYVPPNLSQPSFVLGLQGQSENKTGQVQAGRFLLSLLGVKMQDQKDLNCLWVSRVSADSNLFSVCENLKMDNMFLLNTSEMKRCLKAILRKYFKILQLQNLNTKHYVWIFFFH